MINISLIKQKLKSKKLTLAYQPVKYAFAVLAVAGLLTPGLVRADTFDQQIQQLNSTNNNLQAQTNTLAQEAATFEAKIAELQNQISSLEKQIQENQAKMAEVQAKIAETEAELAVQKKVLGENIRAMYLEGDMSTMEMLASSNDLSEYVDKEQYRLSVQDKIQATMERINQLKTALDNQKKEIEQRLADQTNMQNELAGQRAEQTRLLAMNEAQRSVLNAEIGANSSKINELRRQQAIENARLFGTGIINKVDGSGYPWAGVPFPNEMADPWGMYKRQCVSYTAWKVAASGRNMPYWGGRGNANQWDDNARAAGIPTDYNPRVGDVAVSNSGYYGHVMYVEAVYGDGTIYVSQYNASWTGTYSEARISAGGLVFIHF